MKVLAILVPALLAGCTTAKPLIPETIPTGNAIARADAHVTSADNNVIAAKPHADPTGKALLDQASRSHTQAKTELQNADESNRAATAQMQALVTKERLALESEARLANRWYVMVGRWVEWAFWGLIALASLHVILRLAGVFVSGPVGAALSVAGTIINPFGWIQALCDNLHFRRRKHS